MDIVDSIMLAGAAASEASAYLQGTHNGSNGTYASAGSESVGAQKEALHA
jgi:hypothetical protein